MTLNDLIDVQYVDAAVHDIIENDDILGLRMPYPWGPGGEIKIFNRQEFYEAYPETTSSAWAFVEEDYLNYYLAKSYFNNGGSRIAVYRPVDGMSLFGIETSIGHVVTGDLFVHFKYFGAPAIAEKVGTSITTSGTADNFTVNFIVGSDTIETFTGQINDPAGSFEDGTSSYLPNILAKSSKYLAIDHNGSVVNIPASLSVSENSSEGYEVFAQAETLVATQFINETDNDALLNLGSYETAVFFTARPSTDIFTKDKYNLIIDGQERIKCFGSYHLIPCTAGVAGAYASIARQVNLNQVASAKTYGTYAGVVESSKSFSQVLSDHDEKGIISVFNSTTGPQIFGVRNSYTGVKKSSYFSKANVSRVLSAILRSIKPMCIEAIHTATAADALLRAQFETRLNSVIDYHVSRRNLQADSVAICNASNNSDAQTQGGQILNIILSLHFIGLVERVNIKVVATDSSVTTEIV